MREPTVFKTQDHAHRPGVDAFREVRGGTISEMVDSRISVFTEMGFTAEQAEQALKDCNNDVNEALTLLLNG